MSTIQTIVRNGRIETDIPINLPDGTKLQIPMPENGDETVSETETELALSVMDRMEPLLMSDTELASWEADRQARRDWEKARFFDHAEKLHGIWE